ncbi:unnamed protein product [Ixodes pacificus]
MKRKNMIVVPSNFKKRNMVLNVKIPMFDPKDIRMLTFNREILPKKS